MPYFNENKFSKNIERLKSIVDQKNINFRPHLKTAKCIEITKDFLKHLVTVQWFQQLKKSKN